VVPSCAPSDGETALKFIGIGFTKNAKQVVKFRFNKSEITCKCEYRTEDDSIHCETPDFGKESREDIIGWGVVCKMDVSLDG